MRLEQSIAQFKANPSSENSQELLTLLKESHYFILLHPAVFQDSLIRQQVEKQIQQKKLENLPILMFHTKTQAGSIFPVFTSLEELHKFPNQSSYPQIEVDFRGLYELIQVHPTIENIMLNPEGDSLAFPRQQFLDRFSSAVQGQLIEAHEFPSEFKANLEQGVRKAGTKVIKALNKSALHYPEISKIWVLRQPEEEKFSWLLVLESEIPPQQAHGNLLQELLVQTNSLSGAMCYTSYSPILEVLDNFQPAYVRPYKRVATSSKKEKNKAKKKSS